MSARFYTAKFCSKLRTRILPFIFFVATFSFPGCCEKHPDYTLTDYAKSWLSPYQNTLVSFKNQYDSVVSYIYSDPALLTYSHDNEEGGCSGSVAYTAQDLTMTLSSTDLPVSFGFYLQSYYYGYSEIPEHLDINYEPGCQPDRLLTFANDTVSIGYHMKYLDSVTLNNSSFHFVYVDSNYCQELAVKKILSFYFTKGQGIVGFQTDSALWVLQQ